jgi:hypothetical protein
MSAAAGNDDLGERSKQAQKILDEKELEYADTAKAVERNERAVKLDAQYSEMQKDSFKQSDQHRDRLQQGTGKQLSSFVAEKDLAKMDNAYADKMRKQGMPEAEVKDAIARNSPLHSQERPQQQQKQPQTQAETQKQQRKEQMLERHNERLKGMEATVKSRQSGMTPEQIKEQNSQRAASCRQQAAGIDERMQQQQAQRLAQQQKQEAVRMK